jgi:ArsR family transcriptional regulator, arsenate/arsenite/antimonite-responsive transcriptional repressor
VGVKELLLMEIEEKYHDLAALFKLLANPVRLKILEQLSMNCNMDSSRKCCVNDIKRAVDLPQPYISKHLKILKQSKILEFERKGNKLYYKFKNDNILRELKIFLNRFNSCCKI